MCVAVPMKVIELEGPLARVELDGVTRTVRLDLLEERPSKGDYLIVHAGFALQAIDPDEARITLDLIRKLTITGDGPSD